MSRPIAADLRVSVCLSHPDLATKRPRALDTRRITDRARAWRMSCRAEARGLRRRAVDGALGLRSGWKMVSTSLYINDGRRVMLPTVAARLTEAWATASSDVRRTRKANGCAAFVSK